MTPVGEFRVRWKLVAIVGREYLASDYKELVPEGERYTAEQEREIAFHPYWYKNEGLYFYDDGPVVGRQVGQIVDNDELWPDDCPEEDKIGIYKLLFEKAK